MLYINLIKKIFLGCVFGLIRILFRTPGYSFSGVHWCQARVRGARLGFPSGQFNGYDYSLNFSVPLVSFPIREDL